MSVKNKVKISIDGKSFTLMGDETQEHMHNVAAYIDGKMKEIRRTSQSVSLDSSLAYVLTSINVADDYFKEVERSLELEAQLDELKIQCMTLKATIADLEKKIETTTEQEEQNTSKEFVNHNRNKKRS